MALWWNGVSLRTTSPYMKSWHAVVISVLTVLALPQLACRKPAPKVVVVPEVFRVKFETTQGDFVVEATHAWAPHGVDRFHELVRMRYFDQSRFYRVLPGFIVQFGVHRDFNVQNLWNTFRIVDD